MVQLVTLLSHRPMFDIMNFHLLKAHLTLQSSVILVITTKSTY